MFERFRVWLRSAMYALRGGFLIRPLVIAVVLGAAGAVPSWLEEAVPLIRIKIVAGRRSQIGEIRRRVFGAMHRNALPATEFFRISPNRVIELGSQVEI